MPHQSEQQLEETLIHQLEKLGFNRVIIRDSVELEENLKIQLEKFNKTTFSTKEFSRVRNHLDKGNIFTKAHTLRDRFALTRDDESTFYVRFFNTTQWCQNEYQVANQITYKGKYENRYDVTLLINGLPLVQIELKRRGLEMKEAFNQVKRYQKHSFSGTIFEYIQIFVISNGVNTKYFANNPKQDYAQTFYWTDKNNQKITRLDKFAEAFLEKCALSEIIGEHTVLAEAKKIIMVLRPYQYYAVKAIEKRVKESRKNGYIWHTTGSGKTLTSFKASQVLARMPDIKKILFVVDRKDLDTQTVKEFNSFSEGSVDSTDNTRNLVTQLKDPNQNLIVTTIQKLDKAVARESYTRQFQALADQRVVIIFDECHRSQFGLTHARIKDFFKQAQLFGFTGTPIFADNNVGGVTTKDVFDDCLHKYIITNAISDNNVLGFVVEYVGKYKYLDKRTVIRDILVEGIDTKEALEDDDRLSKITDFVLEDWPRKTKNGKFNAIMAVPSIEGLKKYYTLFKQRKPEDFKVAAIFTFQANEDEQVDYLDRDAFPDEDNAVDMHSRNYLENCIRDYNELYGTNFSTEIFYKYFRNLQDRIKKKEVDLVLVVNMLLTGFDSALTNTLYVDKNLRYHGLIQAYSRTNRLYGSNKPHGNIVVFRNLKEHTDKALKLFGDENAKEVVFKEPYEDQKDKFEQKLAELLEKVPSLEAIDQLKGEEDKEEFVKIFRDLLRIKSGLETFAEFSFDQFKISEQEFYDYQSKYLDLYEGRKQTDRELESVLDQIDFEIELTVRDVINYDYIIQLLGDLVLAKSDRERDKKKQEILQQFDRDVQLRKKKELIQKFIEENMPRVRKKEELEKVFNEFWLSQKADCLKTIAKKENISRDNLEILISDYLYTQKLPHDQEIVDSLQETPRILERQGIIDRIKQAIQDIVDVFEW